MEGVKLQEATLQTIANGALGEQWAEALRQVATIFSEATSQTDCPFETTKNVLTVKVPIEITFDYSMETHTIQVAARLDVKRPKRRWSIGSIFHRNQKWSVAEEGEQIQMFGAQVKAVRKEANRDG